MLRILLIVILVVLLLGALPAWPYSTGSGCLPRAVDWVLFSSS